MIRLQLSILNEIILFFFLNWLLKLSMCWKLLLYGGLFFSKHCYFRSFSTHCGKICMKKAFHLVEHGWLLPYGGTFFLNITTSENFQPMFNNMHQWLRGGGQWDNNCNFVQYFGSHSLKPQFYGMDAELYIL